MKTAHADDRGAPTHERASFSIEIYIAQLKLGD